MQLTLAAPFTPKTITKWHYDANCQVDSITDAGARHTVAGTNADLQPNCVVLPTTASATTLSITYPSSHVESSMSYSLSAANSAAGRFTEQDSLGRVTEPGTPRMTRSGASATTSANSCQDTTYSRRLNQCRPVFPIWISATSVGTDTTEVYSLTWFYDPAGNSQAGGRCTGFHWAGQPAVHSV